MSEAKTDKEKSEELATIIEGMKAYFPLIDLAHAKKVVADMRSQSSRYDTMAVLMRGYTPKKSEVMQKSADAIQALVDFVELNIEIGKLKGEIRSEENHYEQIAKMFSI